VNLRAEGFWQVRLSLDVTETGLPYWKAESEESSLSRAIMQLVKSNIETANDVMVLVIEMTSTKAVIPFNLRHNLSLNSMPRKEI
jgi:hypothetical protein